MIAYLWTGQGDSPPEYVRTILRREYGCTPVELEEIPLPYLLRDLTVLQAESKVQKARNRAGGARGR